MVKGEEEEEEELINNDMKKEDIIKGLEERGSMPYASYFTANASTSSVLLCGIVDEVLPTRKTQAGTDHATSIFLQQASLTSSRTRLIIFHADPTETKDLKKGVLFICQNAQAYSKYQNFNANKTTVWAAFDTITLDKVCQGILEFDLDHQYMDILKLYQIWINLPKDITSTEQTIATNQDNRLGRRLVCTNEMKFRTFIDFIGMVVHSKNVDYRLATRKDVLLTDFTMNGYPMNSGGYYGEGRFIDRTLLINCTLFDENARGCPDLEYGDYVYIKNAQCKLSKHGIMELAVHHDRNPQHQYAKIWIMEDHDTNLMTLKERRSTYEAKNKRLLAYREQRMRKRTKEEFIRNVHRQTIPLFSSIKKMFHSEEGKRHHIRVTILDYKPKNISDMSVKFCGKCQALSDVSADFCSHCKEEIEIIIYRCTFKVKDAHGDIVYGTVYGSSDWPFLQNIPIVNLKENDQVLQQVTKYMEALCPTDGKEHPKVDICMEPEWNDDKLRFVILDTCFRLAEY
ncbi:uncharacterized protein BX664DRAFT_328249 [Halteromyces radiatus]|uniref:uncharacterized protein n=1 Tax=Halteromyces radiatus TaxID=101107 RepID=UPI00221E3CA3|nr:uncharacterized protein BX664DRAFT_328249 [Halteromyces radiatus]KAI8092829.1 hypothetical protein BX664DRAFT_328249 [Halteromyces radiatus]